MMQPPAKETFPIKQLTCALHGFLFILSKEGDLVYISDNVERYLGLTNIDLMGHSIYEFSHPCDHGEIKDILAMKHAFDSDTGHLGAVHKSFSTATSGDSVKGGGGGHHHHRRGSSGSSDQKNYIPSSFFIRMKCTLTNKGRNVNLKSASYKVGVEQREAKV